MTDSILVHKWEYNQQEGFFFLTIFMPGLTLLLIAADELWVGVHVPAFRSLCKSLHVFFSFSFLIVKPAFMSACIPEDLRWTQPFYWPNIINSHETKINFVLRHREILKSLLVAAQPCLSWRSPCLPNGSSSPQAPVACFPQHEDLFNVHLYYSKQTCPRASSCVYLETSLPKQSIYVWPASLPRHATWESMYFLSFSKKFKRRFPC